MRLLRGRSRPAPCASTTRTDRHFVGSPSIFSLPSAVYAVPLHARRLFAHNTIARKGASRRLMMCSATDGVWEVYSSCSKYGHCCDVCNTHDRPRTLRFVVHFKPGLKAAARSRLACLNHCVWTSAYGIRASKMGCGCSKRVGATSDDEPGEASVITATTPAPACTARHSCLQSTPRKALPSGAFVMGMPASLLFVLPPGGASGDEGAQPKPCSVEPFVQSPGDSLIAARCGQ